MEHYQHQYIPFVFHVHNMQPAKPCCLTGIHTDTKLQFAVVRVTTKYLQSTFQLNPLLKFFNSHYMSVLITFNGGRKRKHAVLCMMKQHVTYNHQQPPGCRRKDAYFYLSLSVSLPFAYNKFHIPYANG